MAGSLNHIIDSDGTFKMDTIENLGDAYEALEECFAIIYHLAEGDSERIGRLCEELKFPNPWNDKYGDDPTEPMKINGVTKFDGNTKRSAKMKKKFYQWGIYYLPQKQDDKIITHPLVSIGYGWYVSEEEAKGDAINSSNTYSIDAPIICVMASEVPLQTLKNGIAEHDGD